MDIAGKTRQNKVGSNSDAEDTRMNQAVTAINFTIGALFTVCFAY